MRKKNNQLTERKLIDNKMIHNNLGSPHVAIKPHNDNLPFLIGCTFQ